MSAWIYRGQVVHARLEPVAHRFNYRVAFALLDIDELPRLAAEVPAFGYNRRRPVSLFDRDYLGPGEETLRQKLDRLLERDGGCEARRALLLTCPRFFGYVFNPVSVFWCLRQD